MSSNFYSFQIICALHTNTHMLTLKVNSHHAEEKIEATVRLLKKFLVNFVIFLALFLFWFYFLFMSPYCRLNVKSKFKIMQTFCFYLLLTLTNIFLVLLECLVISEQLQMCCLIIIIKNCRHLGTLSRVS